MIITMITTFRIPTHYILTLPCVRELFSMTERPIAHPKFNKRLSQNRCVESISARIVLGLGSKFRSVVLNACLILVKLANFSFGFLLLSCFRTFEILIKIIKGSSTDSAGKHQLFNNYTPDAINKNFHLLFVKRITVQEIASLRELDE